ncbi:hypothetical protein PR202_ga21397 [Eleusine coracana subsp. coracana]|uniref:Secreted protein n=1 Tax=Eleusine coracana subsp. coracana TaxID=191504 RepID=A0AAV5CZJ4_ELECO|nr:hypothetical protein PR202_ga21397 [Eleusine coracana subsp. coracana]
MNSSISLCSIILVFLVTTTCKSRFFLNTTPCPPPPIIRALSKLFVAFSRSLKIIIILSPMSAFYDINFCNNSPWFCLKCFSSILCTFCFLILRVI